MKEHHHARSSHPRPRRCALREQALTVHPPGDRPRATLDLLSVIRRSGPPYTLSTRELARRTLVTAGAISQRVARAERDGLVERAPGPAGSRTVLVRLTAEGHALIERSVDTVLGREATLVSCLSANERASLIDLLAKLMADVRQRTIHPASHDATASSPSEGTRPENRA